ncbi:MAG: cbb3-type cytochrome c oxidase subunit I [Chlorobi bacterium]|nr:cbb3-type cytochrome c oxidase subunit I [Chlorobiota bacterium]
MSSLLDRKNWWKVMLALSIFSGIGLLFMTVQTYKDAPPKTKFVTNTGKTVFTVGSLEHGQSVFMKYALMDHGSIFGDGGYRGQDYTAECLHETALLMNKYYHDRLPESDDKVLVETAKLGVEEKVRFEIKQNLYNPEKNEVVLTDGQVYAFWEMVKYYSLKFKGKGKEPFTPANFISDENEIKNLTVFFFWSSWACGVLRPGEDASYTQNWPYDKFAGNNVSFPAVFWSIIGCFSLIFALGLVFYFFGKFQSQTTFKPSKDDVATEDSVNQFVPTPTQKATYKFFAIAIFLFFVQVLSGILTIHDFVGFTEFNGYEITEDLPLNITRSWHTQMAILWIATCWIGASIFILPIISPKEPPSQLLLINILFWALFIVVVGSLIGIFVGPKGLAGEYWRWLGHQGWEFLEMGRLWQYGLALGFFIWLVIIYRGVKSSLGSIKSLALPHWILYAVMGIVVMFGFSFVAGPDENFVIADFWRWLVLHMFVECFFETFTTVIIAYFMTIMGLVNKEDANRVVYFAILLFLGSGFLGVSHNFYWNGKPEATLAIGSVFSTMQIVPLVLLTVQAWRFRRLPVDAMNKKDTIKTENSNFGFPEAFLFLIGVNFWNFLGAGVFGFIINLPIINYFEHGTYLTMNHGHAALMGVYGNLSIGGVLFCSRFLLKPGVWNKTLIRTAFWSLNIGLFLMVILNLFPVGLYQIAAVINEGLWFARSNEFIQSQPFQMLTWMRIVGGSIFVVGGVIPLVWFMLTRFSGLKATAATLNRHKTGV